MAFFDNFRERFAPQMQVLQKPALPQIGALPQVTPVKQLTGIGSMLDIVGGTSLLIVVSVGLETIEQVKSQLIMRSYEEM